MAPLLTDIPLMGSLSRTNFLKVPFWYQSIALELFRDLDVIIQRSIWCAAFFGLLNLVGTFGGRRPNFWVSQSNIQVDIYSSKGVVMSETKRGI